MRAAVKSALVIDPVKLPTPPVVTLTASLSSVAVAVSIVTPRIVAPPVRLKVVAVDEPRPVTLAKVSVSAVTQVLHVTVVVLLCRHWPLEPRANRVELVPSKYNKSPVVVN